MAYTIQPLTPCKHCNINPYTTNLYIYICPSALTFRLNLSHLLYVHFGSPPRPSGPDAAAHHTDEAYDASSDDNQSTNQCCTDDDNCCHIWLSRFRLKAGDDDDDSRVEDKVDTDLKVSALCVVSSKMKR